MLPLYQNLVTPCASCVSEKKGNYAPLTERHIQALWLEQKYMRPLYTPQGDRVEVVSPGLWNTEAGPDFLKAHLRIGGQEVKGDIEIHLNDAGWYSHRHHEDDRYNQVVFHLSYWTPGVIRPIIKKNGLSPINAYLENQLTIPLARLLQLIDLDLYPYKRFAGSGQCAQALFRSLPEASIKHLFTSAAYWRCEKKVNYLESRILERPMQLAGGMAMALGYKHNAESLLELFQTLVPWRDLPEKELLAIALGCCGFFEEGFKKSWESSSFYKELRTLWWGRKNEIDHQSQLRLDHIRPLNHPVRRLAYVIKLLQDGGLEGLWSSLLKLWQDYASSVTSKQSLKNFKLQLLDLIPNYQDPYWNTHFLFEIPTKVHHLSLIGTDLKNEIVINVFIPLLHAVVKEAGDPGWWESFNLLYLSYKGVPTSKSRYLQIRFFGNSPKSALLIPAHMLQGAYQVHKDFCLHYEASCEGCPFVQRYKDEQDKQG
jgi:hypothetical protein